VSCIKKNEGYFLVEIKKERNLSVPLFLRLSPDTPSSSHTSAIFMAFHLSYNEATIMPVLPQGGCIKKNERYFW
jgi:hypothetical protein